MISCSSNPLKNKVEYQCEIDDIKSIKNGKISIHEVTEKESKIVLKPVEDIKELIVGCKSDEIFPIEIGILKNLEILTLGGGNFEKMPSEIGNLHKLKLLILITTSLKFMPIEFYKIPTIQRLAVMYNLNEFEFQEELCNLEFELNVWKTTTKFKEIPARLENQNRLKIETKEA